MEWKNEYSKTWVKRFALFPMYVGNTTVWFGYYLERYVEKNHPCECGCNCHVTGWWDRKLVKDVYNA